MLHARAVNELESRVYNGAAPLGALAIPGPANPWGWRGVVDTSDFYALADIDLLGEFDPSGATVYRKPAPGPAIDAAMRLPAFQTFLQFAQVPLWRVSPAADVENGVSVELVDLRFGTPQSAAFLVTATLDANLHVVSSAFQIGPYRGK